MRGCWEVVDAFWGGLEPFWGHVWKLSGTNGVCSKQFLGHLFEDNYI